jgi:hypothetical protein
LNLDIVLASAEITFVGVKAVVPWIHGNCAAKICGTTPELEGIVRVLVIGQEF